MAMTDEEIVRMFLKRNEQALSETMEKYGHYCSSIARNILGNEADAEECVNDALYRVWDSIPPNQPENFKAYIAKITRNLSFNLYQKTHAKKRGGANLDTVLDELAECIPGGNEPEKEFEKQELSAEISRFLSGLSKEKRLMFVARYFYGEPVSEIAKRFAVSENNVSVRLNRLRKALKTHLQKGGFET